ncbi:MAG: hypothetical protein MRERC_1c233 [Mycoplasmataceae bacterium RC_NB112A]|nr:MAG: hypothetical protein MRERC_1c233 [Mycoplasmataceae bacterium RC_NB112A]
MWTTTTKYNKYNWEIDWENFLKESEKERLEREERNLKSAKSGSIAYIKDRNRLNRWEIYHAHWETYLTSHEYWKNWQEKINSFKNQKEVAFYTDRLGTFIDFVIENTRKEVNYIDENSPKQWDPAKTPQMIEQELKRLENISEEEFNKTDKWRKLGPVWKELSVDEMLNEPWLNKQINNLFGLEKTQILLKIVIFAPKLLIFLNAFGLIKNISVILIVWRVEKKKLKTLRRRKSNMFLPIIP